MRTWSEPGLEKFCPGLTWSVCITGTALRLPGQKIRNLKLPLLCSDGFKRSL